MKKTLHEFPSKRRFGSRIHSLRRRNDERSEVSEGVKFNAPPDTILVISEAERRKDRALTSFTLYDAYCSCAPQAKLLTSRIRSRVEYLIPSDNIIALIDTLTWLENRVSLQALIQFIDNYLVTYFWATCTWCGKKYPPKKFLRGGSKNYNCPALLPQQSPVVTLWHLLYTITLAVNGMTVIICTVRIMSL